MDPEQAAAQRLTREALLQKLERGRPADLEHPPRVERGEGSSFVGAGLTTNNGVIQVRDAEVTVSGNSLNAGVIYTNVPTTLSVSR